jgi:DNA-binding PadR family transcriptional regulator
MRGRPSGLLPLEQSVIEAALELRSEGTPVFHGFIIATHMREDAGGRQLTARGTLYKALDRLERRGYLRSRWEDADIAMAEGRPRRRLYEVTAAGEAALAQSKAAPAVPNLMRRPAQT